MSFICVFVIRQKANNKAASVSWREERYSDGAACFVVVMGR